MVEKLEGTHMDAPVAAFQLLKAFGDGDEV